eukprot:194897-Pyramimonas_sp.AAC.1
MRCTSSAKTAVSTIPRTPPWQSGNNTAPTTLASPPMPRAFSGALKSLDTTAQRRPHLAGAPDS